MLIAIPSKGRAGLTTTQKVFRENGVFYVPESEYHQYKGVVKHLVGVPKEVRGITKTRNWILQNTDSAYVVMIDDDVKYCGYNKIVGRQMKKIEIREEAFWMSEFWKYFDMCEQLGFKIWGTRTESSPRGCYPYKPFLFKTYVTASLMGIINDGEYMFDESFPVKEDYEICLRHIVDKGGVLGVRYLHWENDHWDQDGGCKDYRTIGIERKAIKDLIRMYPGMVKSAKRKANEFCIELNL